MPVGGRPGGQEARDRSRQAEPGKLWPSPFVGRTPASGAQSLGVTAEQVGHRPLVGPWVVGPGGRGPAAWEWGEGRKPRESRNLRDSVTRIRPSLIRR